MNKKTVIALAREAGMSVNPGRDWPLDISATEISLERFAALVESRARAAEPEQPVAVKQMLRWVEHLKRLSDDGQHMSIPGLSSGACWELAIELEQFIKNTAPTPRKPLTEGEIADLWEGQLFHITDLKLAKDFVRDIERAHGITGETNE